jgi:hypothetical protein
LLRQPVEPALSLAVRHLVTKSSHDPHISSIASLVGLRIWSNPDASKEIGP